MNPYLARQLTVVSFSGGRSSAYMLRKVLDANPDRSNLIVTFANTGKEHEATLEFVRDCEMHWGVPIIWLEYRAEAPGFAVVTFETASRNGEPFADLVRKRSYLPNPVTRFCTIDLKIRVIHKYLRSLGLSTEDDPVDMMTGIRADEPRRVAKIRARKATSESKWATMVMPLADASVMVRDVSAFWEAQPFDLGVPTINGKALLGNCDLCFLKGAAQVYSIIASEPARADWWAEQEERINSTGKYTGNGARFRSDRPGYREMQQYASVQGDMLGHDEAIDCFCGD
jgi:3'-phosphoadenosine 5'-phosphosulfate sulfotransferase (PAPS reductase)/FAD synthetase